ncbi:MAG: hypothetical protein FWC98_02980 [Bacteroidales bacterium]|nr:hypothetical protein [Bacteroidales bacterium]
MENLMNLNKKGVPADDTKEAKKQRKQFIKDFYRLWEIVNPTKKVFNKSLNDFINVRHVSVHETSGHASHRYISTLAIMFLSEILENAVQKGRPKNPKRTQKNQKGFEKIITMEYFKKELGAIKLTVGVKRGTKEKIQYCVTAIKND